ncbi:hypothetical protein [Pseudoxanthomonas kaohsiungensis]|uniref:Uncharacterized protein n=1 Tax=Pseudoxanthomonas kaohsiungensis TaxID=283923 RepID=A0ABW3M1K5_9GAMM|nr:hypothetical protein [Pseudoxanthomonas kaohsiungensis]
MSIGVAPLQPQPAQRPGEVLADSGRWNAAALRRLATLGNMELTWKAGALAHVAVVGGVAIGNIHRHRPEHPWILKIEGFEFWHEPTRVITKWHYTPNRGIRNLAEAKREFRRIIAARPAPDTVLAK